jgi:hypothetical protein
MVYSLALFQVLSSKSMAHQLAGSGSWMTLGLAVSPLMGPRKKFLVFQVALI